MADRVLLGRIAGAHGVRGEVRLASFTEQPEAIAAYGPLSDKSGKRQFALVLKGRVRGDNLVAAIAGIGDRNQAEALAGTELYVDRTQLPAIDDEAEYYHVDLIGLDVEDEDGRALGRVMNVADYGAGPMLEIRGEGGELLLPFTDAVVPVVDLAGGRLVVVPPAEIEARPPAGSDADGEPSDEPAAEGTGGDEAAGSDPASVQSDQNGGRGQR
ncbi:MAG: ribosome maturation factor RimM [Dongiaceae bacterium]